MKQKMPQVLIVDDMTVNRMILSSLLAGHGIVCDQADSGGECIRLCREKDYDLILLDHRMPETDGVDTFVLLKEIFEKRGKTPPVICHTTEEGRKNINLYKAAGFADVLIKPIDPVLLSEVLMTYLPGFDMSEKEKPADVADDSNVPAEGAEAVTEADPGEEQEDELDKLPLWLKSVPHIDLVDGLENCGSARDYLDALYVFYSSIEDKAAKIRWTLEMRDYTGYRMLVHSLKSTSALIGLNRLSLRSKELEDAAKNQDRKKLADSTPELLSSYVELINLLKPIKDHSCPPQTPKTAPETEEKTAKEDLDTILFIRKDHGLVTAGIENTLRKAGFKVFSIDDEPGLIIANRFASDIVLYMPSGGEESHTILTMNLLGEICHDDSKILCLAGDHWELEYAMSANGAFRVAECYPRPVDTDAFIRDIREFSRLEREYHTRKNLFLVDDDQDYLGVIQRWLSSEYNVSCFESPSRLLEGLGTAIPDLVLMDYEMPEMDGYELMMSLRTREATKNIPVIFLTGKNDRDHVNRILEYRPDGYLLKTSQKDSLMEALHRFFSESLYKKAARVRATQKKQQASD